MILFNSWHELKIETKKKKFNMAIGEYESLIQDNIIKKKEWLPFSK